MCSVDDKPKQRLYSDMVSLMKILFNVLPLYLYTQLVCRFIKIDLFHICLDKESFGNFGLPVYLFVLSLIAG